MKNQDLMAKTFLAKILNQTKKNLSDNVSSHLPSITINQLESQLFSRKKRQIPFSIQKENQHFNSKELNVCSPFYDRLKTHQPNCKCPYHKRIRMAVQPVRKSQKMHLMSHKTYNHEKLKLNPFAKTITRFTQGERKSHKISHINDQTNTSAFTIKRVKSQQTKAKVNSINTTYEEFLKQCQYFILKKKGFQVNKKRDFKRKGAKEIFSYIKNHLDYSVEKMSNWIRKTQKDKDYGDFYVQRFKEMKENYESNRYQRLRGNRNQSKIQNRYFNPLRKQSGLNKSNFRSNQNSSQNGRQSINNQHNVSNKRTSSLSSLSLQDLLKKLENNDEISDEDLEKLFSLDLNSFQDAFTQLNKNIMNGKYSNELINKLQAQIVNALRKKSMSEFNSYDISQESQQELSDNSDNSDGSENQSSQKSNQYLNKKKTKEFQSTLPNSGNFNISNKSSRKKKNLYQSHSQYPLMLTNSVQENCGQSQKNNKNRLKDKYRSKSLINSKDFLQKMKIINDTYDCLMLYKKKAFSQNDRNSINSSSSKNNIQSKRNSLNKINQNIENGLYSLKNNQEDFENKKNKDKRNTLRHSGDGARSNKQSQISSMSDFDEDYHQMYENGGTRKVLKTLVNLGNQNVRRSKIITEEDLFSFSKFMKQHEQDEAENQLTAKQKQINRGHLRKAEQYLYEVNMGKTVVKKDDSLFTAKRKVRVIKMLLKETPNTQQKNQLEQYVRIIQERCYLKTQKDKYQRQSTANEPITQQQDSQPDITKLLTLENMGYDLKFYSLTSKVKLQDNQDLCILLNELKFNKGNAIETKITFKNHFDALEQNQIKLRKGKKKDTLIQLDMRGIQFSNLTKEKQPLQGKQNGQFSLDCNKMFSNASIKPIQVEKSLSSIEDSTLKIEDNENFLQFNEQKLKELDKQLIKKRFCYAKQHLPKTFNAYLQNTNIYKAPQ